MNRRDLPLLDEERLALLAEDLGREKLAELCEAARQSIAETEREMAVAWIAGDRLLIGRHAHRLVGAAANFGLPAMAALARKIEDSCRDGNDGKAFASSLEKLVELSFAALAGSKQK